MRRARVAAGAKPLLKSRMAAMSVASVAVFLGLAVVSAGGVSAVASRPPMLALGAVTVAMFVAALFTRASLSSGEREDRGNRWVIGALGVLGLAIAILPPLGDRNGWLVVGGVGVRWLGVVLYALGGALRLAPVFVLGERFSGLAAIQPGHQLVTTGLYAKIRHPSYLGLLTLCLGWALAFRSLPGVAIALLMAIPIVGRINAEERLLAERFGAQYEAYRARTWRLLPGLY